MYFFSLCNILSLKMSVQKRRFNWHNVTVPTEMVVQVLSHISLPFLFVQQSEQRASWDILGYNGKLARVIQTRPHKLDDTGVIEATEDGDLSAEHIYIWFGAVRIGPITTTKGEHWRKHWFPSHESREAKYQIKRLNEHIPFYGDNFVSALSFVDPSKRAWWETDLMILSGTLTWSGNMRVTWSNNLIELQLRQLKMELRWEAHPEQQDFCFLWKILSKY